MPRDFRLYSFTGWMAKYRPSGKGSIGLTIEGREPVVLCEFAEVICDFCNAEIPPAEILSGDIKVESFIVASDGYALCWDCGHKLLVEQDEKGVQRADITIEPDTDHGAQDVLKALEAVLPKAPEAQS